MTICLVIVFHLIFTSFAFSKVFFFLSNIILLLMSFFTPELTVGLSLDSVWKQISLILQDTSQYSDRSSNPVVWMISIRPPISNSSNPLTKPLETVPSTLVTIGITVTLIFHSFVRSLAWSKYLTLFSFSLVCWDGKVHYTTVSFFLLLTITKSGLLTGIGWSICISKYQKILSFSFSRIYSNFSAWSNFSLLPNFQRITFRTQSCLVWYSFCVSYLGNRSFCNLQFHLRLPYAWYSNASYQFLFLSSGFCHLATSKSFHVQFPWFISKSIHTVIFLSIFAFYIFSLYIFTNPFTRIGCDTILIFKRRLTVLNSKFSFS